MRAEILKAFGFILVMTVLLGFMYPLAITGFARVAFPTRATGSLVSVRGQVVGSKLIGQEFSHPAHFQGRPSATAAFPYDSSASSGSNLGPTNPALIKAVESRVLKIRAASPASTATAPVPIDLVTASASGLDPHISLAAALCQVDRVADARHMNPADIRRLVLKVSEDREWLILGEPRVNVLKLNLCLDETSGGVDR